MKLVRIGSKAVIYLEGNVTIMNDTFTDEDMVFVSSASDEEIKAKYISDYADYFKQSEIIKDVVESVQGSKYLNFDNGLITIPSISEVSVPKYLADKLLEAEINKDTNKVSAYLNFWTLSCQNSNAEARNNLLYFLETHGFKILKSGLFISYRNAHEVTLFKSLGLTLDEHDFIMNKYQNIKKVQKKSPKKYIIVRDNGVIKVVEKKKIKPHQREQSDLLEYVESETFKGTIFTDNRTKKMRIKLGCTVAIPREECDEDSNNSCSRGLHLAKKDWADLGSFGTHTIMCLCNPANVVAVPPIDSYGKIRTCEYFPVRLTEFDSNGKIVEDIEDGSELNYFNVSYDGVINNEKATEFQIQMPQEVNLDAELIKTNLAIIKETLLNKKA